MMLIIMRNSDFLYAISNLFQLNWYLVLNSTETKVCFGLYCKVEM